MSNDGKRNYITATIASGGTSTGAIDISGFVLCAIKCPAMTGTALSFTAAETFNGTYVPLANSSDTNLAVTVSGTAKMRVVSPQDFAGVRFINITSNGTEGAERTLVLIGYEA